MPTGPLNSRTLDRERNEEYVHKESQIREAAWTLLTGHRGGEVVQQCSRRWYQGMTSSGQR